MSYHPAVNAAGYAVLTSTGIVSGAIWFAGQIAEVPTSVVNAAGANAITACVLTITAMLVNGYVADRKSRRESDERVATSALTTDRKVAEAKAEADRKLLDAKAEADARIATLEARLAMGDQLAEAASHERHHKMDQLYTMVNGLYVHAQLNSAAINEMIPAVQESAARAGSAVPDVAPVASPFQTEPVGRLIPAPNHG